MRSNRLITIIMLLTLVAALSGCASKGIRDQAPFVVLNSMRLAADELQLQLSVRNINSVAMDLSNIEFSFTVDDQSLAVYNASSMASISANGTENLRFSLSPTEQGVSLLQSLESGERKSLSYEIEGEVLAQENTRLEISKKGFLYPVPGRPGQFR